MMMPVTHAPADYTCPFCRIAQGVFDDSFITSPDDIVYRDDQVTAFIGARQYPTALGNTLIIPNTHYEHLYELGREVMEPLLHISQRLAIAMKLAWPCAGVSMRQHNEPAGNQEVWHYHQHLTPRYMGDDLYDAILHDGFWMSAVERARLAHDLRAYL